MAHRLWPRIWRSIVFNLNWSHQGKIVFSDVTYRLTLNVIIIPGGWNLKFCPWGWILSFWAIAPGGGILTLLEAFRPGGDVSQSESTVLYGPCPWPSGGVGKLFLRLHPGGSQIGRPHVALTRGVASTFPREVHPPPDYYDIKST